MKIYKYELPSPGGSLVIKEKVIKFLDVQNQNDIAMVWAIVDPYDKSEETTIMAFGTGWDVPYNANEYIGTAQDEFGYVWHYFTVNVPELKKKEIKVETKAEKAPIGIDTIQFDAEALMTALGQIGFSAQEATSALNKVSNMWKDVL